LGVVAGLLVGFVVGWGIGRVSTGTPTSPFQGKGGFEAGYEAAKMKLKEAGLLPATITEIQSLSGEVTSVSDGTIVMKTMLRNPNPLDEVKYPEARTITVTEDTKIIKQTPRDPQEMQKAFTQFQKDLAAGKTGLQPPLPFIQEELELEDIKQGDVISVTADHNILTETSFAAVEITVQPGAPSGNPDRGDAPTGGSAVPPPPPPPPKS
jgi:hypothetical protein